MVSLPEIHGSKIYTSFDLPKIWLKILWEIMQAGLFFNQPLSGRYKITRSARILTQQRYVTGVNAFFKRCFSCESYFRYDVYFRCQANRYISGITNGPKNLADLPRCWCIQHFPFILSAICVERISESSCELNRIRAMVVIS